MLLVCRDTSTNSGSPKINLIIANTFPLLIVIASAAEKFRCYERVKNELSNATIFCSQPTVSEKTSERPDHSTINRLSRQLTATFSLQREEWLIQTPDLIVRFPPRCKVPESDTLQMTATLYAPI